MLNKKASVLLLLHQERFKRDMICHSMKYVYEKYHRGMPRSLEGSCLNGTGWKTFRLHVTA